MSTQTNPNDFLLSVGVKSAKFSAPGDTVVGIITRQPEVQQQRDPGTGELKFWSDGNPRLQLKVVVQTDEHDDDEDSGERAIYVKGQLQAAVAQAVRSARAAGLEIGGKLQVKYVKNGVATQRGLNAPKIYEARYKAPEIQPVPVPEGPGDDQFDDAPVPDDSDGWG